MVERLLRARERERATETGRVARHRRGFPAKRQRRDSSPLRGGPTRMAPSDTTTCWRHHLVLPVSPCDGRVASRAESFRAPIGDGSSSQNIVIATRRESRRKLLSSLPRLLCLLRLLRLLLGAITDEARSLSEPGRWWSDGLTRGGARRQEAKPKRRPARPHHPTRAGCCDGRTRYSKGDGRLPSPTGPGRWAGRGALAT